MTTPSGMTDKEALATVVDIASRWGENQEEGYVRRLMPEDSDETCHEIAEQSGALDEDVIEVRDLWRALAVMNTGK